MEATSSLSTDPCRANTRWLMLTNALSGLFCASMNFIDSTKTIRPQLTFDREGTNGTENLHLLHGALPHEVVCTENLTPLLKLLPCKGKVGISSLLDGHKLFDATWQSMAIDVRPVCQDGQCQVEIQQTVDMVLDADRASRPSKDPIPRPPPIENIACNLLKPYNTDDTCFPELAHGKRPWSVSQVFGRSIQGSCPLGMTEEPEVHVHAPPDREVKVNCTGEFKQREQAYNLPSTAAFDLEINSGPDESIQLDRPRLYAERTFTGPGQETGGVHAVLTNPSTEDLDVVYLESLPWFMRVYIHTLRVRVTSSDAQPTEAAIEDMVYRPAVDRVRGSQLELRMAVPAKSTLTLTYDFEKAILRYTEYPPDANRGFDVAPAVIRILPNGRGGESQYVRTTSLLLPLPTPDFSMPYNVIILTSTVIAMGFGSMFNLIVRRFVAADEVGVAGLAAVKARLRARLSAVRARFGASAAQKKLQ